MTIPEEIEHLKTRLIQTAGEHEQAEVLVEILKKYAYINSVDSQRYIDRLLQLAEKLHETVYNAWGLNALAYLHGAKAEYDISMKLSQEAIVVFLQVDEKNGIAYSYANMGLVYFNQCNYSEALKNFIPALKIREEIGDKQGIAASYNNIGAAYFHQAKFPKALESYFASLKIRDEIGDRWGIGRSYSNIGNVYLEQRNYHEALKSHFASLKIREEIGDKSGSADSYNNIGILYELQTRTIAGGNKKSTRIINAALRNPRCKRGL